MTESDEDDLGNARKDPRTWRSSAPSLNDYSSLIGIGSDGASPLPATGLLEKDRERVGRSSAELVG
jgi:hypothetical protein